MIPDANASDVVTDPLARETVDVLETWHRKDGGQEDFPGDVPAMVTQFACHTGPPSHRYNPACPVGKAEVAESMASTLVSLLLTCFLQLRISLVLEFS